MAAMAALHLRRSPADPRGVLNHLFLQPLGPAVVAALTVALAFFTVWRLAVAFVGRRADGSRVTLWMRLFLLVSAGIHGALALSAGRLFALRRAIATSEAPTRAALKTVMDLPYGRLAVTAIALALVGIGIGKLIRSYLGRIWGDVTFRAVKRRHQRLIVMLGRVGEATRGVILLVIGGYGLQAAARYDPSGVRGFAGALRAMETFPFGGTLLMIAAAGLFCYGLFLVSSARYQKI